MNPDDVKAFFDAHWTVRAFQPVAMPAEHLDVLLHAAQRAPTDATAQMYSFVRLVDSALRGKIAELTHNPHFATASEALVVCADVHRLRLLLERGDFTYGSWSAASVHFAIGDAVLAGQNLLTAAEMLGYRGCWIGGVLSALPEIVDLLRLPSGVVPFSGLVVGVPAEAPRTRPRVARDLVVHQDAYREPSPEELDGALADMASITARGNWAQSLARYFASDGTMEAREVLLRRVLLRQGFDHVRLPGEVASDPLTESLDALFEAAERAGFSDVRVRRRGGGFEAWLDRVEVAHRGDGSSPSEALRSAIADAERSA
ncbi:nitroreductase family protein [Deinococcus yavapaiensis]|uniref:Nitroreductase n=1 Tax=Deinococcus yavapaiensis KR-236 TaxID=694435 RepID=A0A318SF69_9DEIO|nr:nitroreductase [Deinococcus yavapaiensis KR-236]